MVVAGLRRHPAQTTQGEHHGHPPGGSGPSSVGGADERRWGASETSPAPTVVLHVGRQYRASEKAVAEAALLRHGGVLSVEANPAAQTATVRYTLIWSAPVIGSSPADQAA